MGRSDAETSATTDKRSLRDKPRKSASSCIRKFCMEPHTSQEQLKRPSTPYRLLQPSQAPDTVRYLILQACLPEIRANRDKPKYKIPSWDQIRRQVYEFCQEEEREWLIGDLPRLILFDMRRSPTKYKGKNFYELLEEVIQLWPAEPLKNEANTNGRDPEVESQASFDSDQTDLSLRLFSDPGRTLGCHMCAAGNCPEHDPTYPARKRPKNNMKQNSSLASLLPSITQKNLPENYSTSQQNRQPLSTPQEIQNGIVASLKLSRPPRPKSHTNESVPTKTPTESESKFSKLERIMCEMEKRMLVLEKKNTELENKNSELAKRVDSFEKENIELKKKNSEFHNRITTLQSISSEQGRRLLQLVGSLDTLRSMLPEEYQWVIPTSTMNQAENNS